MRISLSKHRGVPVLTCTRSDGSMTYSKSRHGEFFGPHDLMHIAFESTLGLRRSFFGLIAAGLTIEETSDPARLNDEAILTEHAVNLLMLRQPHGEWPSASEFVREWAAATKREPDSLPRIDDAALARVRERFTSSLARYRALGEGERLDFEWPEA